MYRDALTRGLSAATSMLKTAATEVRSQRKNATEQQSAGKAPWREDCAGHNSKTDSNNHREEQTPLGGVIASAREPVRAYTVRNWPHELSGRFYMAGGELPTWGGKRSSTRHAQKSITW
jgi:O-glycosyl hydrolase